ncbi:hypothetical protein E2C01_013747 [Portunus trituberculatus]|uniref:Uncharacterized protein n=1 Tax=Portunus trituberculatus TaxID=210409 RepID=A0A5B7DHF7_PORTR|nr:hypothetical protein [Portunus trituberculatus]
MCRTQRVSVDRSRDSASHGWVSDASQVCSVLVGIPKLMQIYLALKSAPRIAPSDPRSPPPSPPGCLTR